MRDGSGELIISFEIKVYDKQSSEDSFLDSFFIQEFRGTCAQQKKITKYNYI